TPRDLTTPMVVLERASVVALSLSAPSPPRRALDAFDAPRPARSLRRRRRGLRLQELERLHVQERRRPGYDLGVCERLQELRRAVEVAHPDPHRAEALGDVGVRARPRDDPILGGEASGLLVERADRHAWVEDLDRIDVVEDLQQMLVVRD